MMDELRARTKRWLFQHGWDVQRVSGISSPAGATRRLLQHHGINLVFDVGANAGQFGHHLRECEYRGHIVSFEPLSAAYPRLIEAARGDARWAVAPRMAIGDTDGELTMNVSANLVSSSPLGALPLLEEAAPAAGYQATERAPVRRLDGVGRAYMEDGSLYGAPLPGAIRAFLKIDVQGFEHKVLDGAAGLLPQLCGIQCELSLVPLYDGQQLWRSLIDRLEGFGFATWAIFPGFSEARTGRLLQMDGVFFRDPTGRPAA
jgi:FkbM family methyltransferase